MKNFNTLLALLLLPFFAMAQQGNSNSQGNSNGISSQAYSSNATTYTFGKDNWNVYCFNGDILYSPANSNYLGMYTENNVSFDSRSRWANTSLPSNANASSGIAYSGAAPLDIKHSVSYKRVGFSNSYYKLEVPAHDDHASLLIDGVEVWRDPTYTTKPQVVWSGYLTSNSTIEFRWINFALTSNGSLTLTPSVALSFHYEGFLVEKTENKNVRISWNTTNEKNMEAYSIEKKTESNDGIIQELTTLKAKGNTTKTTLYEWIDTNPSEGVSYYRIKGVDKNGNTTYSDYHKFDSKDLSSFTVAIFPNPATNQQVTVRLNNATSRGKAIVRVIDSFGKTIQIVSFDLALTNTYTLENSTNLAIGVYHVICEINNQYIHQELLIL